MGIQKKVEKFKFELNQELLNILSNEREKEDQRECRLVEEQNSEERKRLQTLFENERSVASSKIYAFNQ